MTEQERRRVAAVYDENAAAYEELWAPVLHPFGRELVAAMPLAGSRRILDLCTGLGTLLPALRDASPAATIVGADLSEGMLSRAPSAFPRAVADASELPFRDTCFDAAVMAFSLFLFSEPGEPLSEVRRALRTGAPLGVAVWGEDPGFPAEELWDRTLDEFGAGPREALAEEGLTDSPQKLVALLEGAGFTIGRAWTRRLNHAPDLEGYIELKTRMGSGKMRLESVPPERRGALLAELRGRLEPLEPRDFSDPSEIILTVASAC